MSLVISFAPDRKRSVVGFEAPSRRLLPHGTDSSISYRTKFVKRGLQKFTRRSHFFAVNAVVVAFVAHTDVFVVAAEADLRPLGDNFPVFVEARVDRRLSAAAANRLDFRNAVGNLEQPLAAREHLGLKVGAKPKAEHRHVEAVDNVFELFNLFFG